MVDGVTIIVRYSKDMPEEEVRRLRERITSALSSALGPIEVVDTLNSDYLFPSDRHPDESAQPRPTPLGIAVLHN